MHGVWLAEGGGLATGQSQLSWVRLLSAVEMVCKNLTAGKM